LIGIGFDGMNYWQSLSACWSDDFPVQACFAATKKALAGQPTRALKRAAQA